MIFSKLFPAILLIAAISCGSIVTISRAAEAPPATPEKKPPFAIIGDVTIEADAFIQTLNRAVKQKFYHGHVPQEEMAKFQREVGAQIVERILLIKEAEKRKIVPNPDEVNKVVAEYEKRYKGSEKWQADKDKMLPSVIRELNAKSIHTQLEAMVRRVPAPSTDEVLAFYQKNPKKFTMPMDQKISIILLKVDPSAGGAAWKEATKEAAELVKKLRSGANFAEMARARSGDISAADGGLMLATHKGALAEDAEKAIDKIQPGEVTDPVVVLEGVAIFQLNARTPPKLVAFKDARKRAEELLYKEWGDQAWAGLKTRLRQEIPVTIHEEYYLPLPKGGGDSAGSKPTHQEGKP